MSAILDYSSKPPVIRCPHCQDALEVRLPETLEVCIKTMQDFDKKHARCWIDRQMRKTSIGSTSSYVSGPVPPLIGK